MIESSCCGLIFLVFSFCILSYLCIFVYYREHWESSHTGVFLCGEESLRSCLRLKQFLERNSKIDILGCSPFCYYSLRSSKEIQVLKSQTLYGMLTTVEVNFVFKHSSRIQETADNSLYCKFSLSACYRFIRHICNSSIMRKSQNSICRGVSCSPDQNSLNEQASR